MGRFEGRDRIESEGLEFHLRVREEFLRLAGGDTDRYAVVDADTAPETIAGQVWARVAPLLPGGAA